MTDDAIDTLLYFLRRVYVPQGEQASLLWAVQQLEALRNKEKQAA